MSTSIYRVKHDKENPYVMLNKVSLWDKNLSLKAVGLWVRLMSRPDDWSIRSEELAKSCGTNQGTIKKYLRELIEAGYAFRRKIHDEKTGKFQCDEFLIFETKHTKEMLDDLYPSTKKPSVEKPPVVNPPPTNIDNTKDILKTDISLVSPEVETLKNSFYEEIRKAKPDYSKKPSKNWDDKIRALLKIRSTEQILKALRWALQDEFWKSNVLSPNGLYNNLDMIETKMIAKPSGENKCDLMQVHESEARSHDTFGQNLCSSIVAGINGVEFICGSNCRFVPYDLSQAEWEYKTGWKKS